ncbi:uncharacterized protein LOC34620982 [Cyclospora cayetanensis]|uniref:Uncharacterized protein LOC34620982 n=1 Tax=Cyclospora cayetanensis TaxID=88456 RepID=A0A6P6RXU9_9EIME|nr:uncharacterized protein LOC34620982 [Cyclospora cayetanensis]
MRGFVVLCAALFSMQGSFCIALLPKQRSQDLPFINTLSRQVHSLQFKALPSPSHFRSAALPPSSCPSSSLVHRRKEPFRFPESPRNKPTTASASPDGPSCGQTEHNMPPTAPLLVHSAPKPLSSSGILPVVAVGGRWCLLLYNATGGSKANVLTDFGGKREYVEPSGHLAPPPPPSGIRSPTQTLETPTACAARELYEETGGLWGLGALVSPPIGPRPRAPVPVQSIDPRSKRNKKKNKAREQGQCSNEKQIQQHKYEESSVQQRTQKERDVEALLESLSLECSSESCGPTVTSGAQRGSPTRIEDPLKDILDACKEVRNLGGTSAYGALWGALVYPIGPSLRDCLTGLSGSVVCPCLATFSFGTLERDRYSCTLRHLSFIPSSLFLNLRGEEGEGAERNRRFFLMHLGCSESNQRQPPELPLFHIRLRTRNRAALFQKIIQTPVMGTSGEGLALQSMCIANESCIPLPIRDTADGGPHQVALTKTLEEDPSDARGIEPSSPGGPCRRAQNGTPHKTLARGPTGESVEPPTNLLDVLLPSRSFILHSASALRKYLREHTRGLMSRCGGYKKDFVNPAQSFGFVGEEAAVGALLKSSLW